MSKPTIYEPGEERGNWTILHEAPYEPRPGFRVFRAYMCRCRCGNECKVTVQDLKRSRSRRCTRCHHENLRAIALARRAELIGTVSGNWTVIDHHENIRYMWAQCRCGAIAQVETKTLRNKEPKACKACYYARRDPTPEAKAKPIPAYLPTEAEIAAMCLKIREGLGFPPVIDLT